jgi:thioredoxin
MNKLIKSISTGLLLLLIISCNAQKETVLNADAFEKAIATGSVQILDVRTSGEFNSGHIKNALQANWNEATEFERRISFIDKNKPVYVYCLAGGRSAAAASKMRNDGYKQVYELQGGINAWKAANKSLEGKSTAAQMTIETFNAALQSSPTVLVDFGAAWCPPCKVMEPVLQNLQKTYPNKFLLFKVDGGNDENIMKQFGVTALPVFIIFKNGKQVWRKDGIAEEKELAAQLQ